MRWLIWCAVLVSGFCVLSFISLRTKDLVKLDRFNEQVLLAKERTLLELTFAKVPLMQLTNAFIDKSHCKSFSQLGEFQGSWYQLYCFVIAFYNCPQPVKCPSTTQNKPWNTREPPVNHPWTTREPPVNHPWITREPPVIHPWTIRETSVLETQKTGLETWKTDFVPWVTRETPVKHPWSNREATVNYPWSTREWSGDAQWTCINGQIVSIFAGSQYQIRSAIALFLKTTHVCMNQVSLKTDSKQWCSWSVDRKRLERFREVIGERNFKWSS